MQLHDLVGGVVDQQIALVSFGAKPIDPLHSPAGECVLWKTQSSASAGRLRQALADMDTIFGDGWECVLGNMEGVLRSENEAKEAIERFKVVSQEGDALFTKTSRDEE